METGLLKGWIVAWSSKKEPAQLKSAEARRMFVDPILQ